MTSGQKSVSGRLVCAHRLSKRKNHTVTGTGIQPQSSERVAV